VSKRDPDAKKQIVAHRQALYDAARKQRMLCVDWLLYIMASSSVKTRTKDDLRTEAIKRFKISKKAFDGAWIQAIEKTGNRHWYEPLPKSQKKAARTLLA
jgi:hypothetical protein